MPATPEAPLTRSVRAAAVATMLMGLTLSASTIYWFIFGGVDSGLGLMFLGGFALVGIGWKLRAWSLEVARREANAMSPESFLALTASHPLGFWICTRCRIVMPNNLTADCLGCQSTVATVEVSSEQERRIAIAAIGEA